MAKVVLKFETNDANGKKLEIDDGSIVSLNSLSQSSSYSSGINYGCIANTGSMTIVDFNGNIAKQIKEGTMPSSNVDVDLYVNNNKIQSHITTDSTYDESTNEFNVSVTNRIADWDILKYNGYIYRDKSATLYEILADVFSVVSDSLDDALSEIIVYTYPEDGSFVSKQGTIKDYLQLISVEYPYIEYGYTIRQIIDDICTIAQLQCFIDDNDKIKFVSARPISIEQNIPMVIDNSIILNDINSDLFIRNKYDGVELYEYNGIYNNHTAIYESSMITLYSGKEFIGNNEGVNKEEYSITRHYHEAWSYINIKYIFDLKDVSSDFAINPDNIDDIKLRLTINNQNYTYVVNISGFVDGSESIDLGSSSEIKILNPLDTPTSREAYYFIFNRIENSSKLSFDIFLPYGGLPSGAYGNGSYPYSYIQYFTFEILKTAISFNKISVNSENIEYAKTKASLNLSTKLLQTQTTLSGVKMSDIIKHNIVTDYKNGLQSAKLKVVCSDMYNQNGDLIKNWKLGKILENNDLIQVDDKKSKINSRNFIYDGSPEIELQTLEQKIIFFYGLFKDSDGVYSWNHLIDSGKISVYTLSGGRISISSTDTSLDGYLVFPDVVDLMDNCFSGCSLITRFIFKEGLESIGDGAFSGCSSLESIQLPSSVTSIGYGAFSGCSSLNEIIIPYGVKTLFSTFYNCSNIKNIEIPDSVVTISEAFQFCSSLNHIFIPASVMNMISSTAGGWSPPFAGSPNVVIYCEAASDQSGWEQYWNTYARELNNNDQYEYSYLTVKYGYTREQYEAEVGLR